MNRSTERILTTHAGSLPRPDDLVEMMWNKMDGQPVDEAALQARIAGAVDDVVRKQHEVGIDVVSDGELGKPGFSTYVEERFSGFDGRSEFQADDVAPFPNLAMRLFATDSMAHVIFSNCVGPVEIKDPDAVKRDIEHFKHALNGTPPSEAFMGAISPGQIAFNYPNQHYPSHEAYLEALADALHYEYQAIADAGFNLQIDSPDLAMAAHSRSVGSSINNWDTHLPLAIDALNRALDGIPREQVRLHVCWGNYAGPHHCDIPLEKILPEVLKANAATIYPEGANPRHEHEWEVFKDVPAARRHGGHPRDDRHEVQLRRAPEGGRQPADAAGQHHRARERAGRHRLRLRHVHPLLAGGSRRRVAEAQGHGRRRRAGVRGALPIRVRAR